MMKRRLVLATAIVLMAVPGFAQKVTVDYDREYDGPLGTYTWAEPQEARISPLMAARLVAAIDAQMEAGGHKKVAEDEGPDVILTYHASAQDEVVVTSDHFGYRYGPGWRWGAGMGPSTSRTRTYTKGTLVIDIWTAKDKRLIFRGTITDTVSDKPEKNEQKINSGVEKLVKELDKQLKRDAKNAEKPS
jgi:hypothetical protein